MVQWKPLGTTGHFCKNYVMCLKLNVFEDTTSVESPASTQLHVNGVTSKARDEQNPCTRVLKEAETYAHSHAQGAQNDKISAKDW